MSFSLGGPRLGCIHPCGDSRKDDANEAESAAEAEMKSTTATNSPSFSGTSRRLFSAEKVLVTPRHPRPRLHSSLSSEGQNIHVAGEEDLSRNSLLRKSANQGLMKRRESGGGENASGWALLDAKAPLVATSRSKPSRKTEKFSDAAAAFPVGEDRRDVSRLRSTHVSSEGEFPLHHRRSTAKPAKEDNRDCPYEEGEVYRTDIPTQREENGGELLIQGEGDGNRENNAYRDTSMSKRTFHSSACEGKAIDEPHSSSSARQEGDESLEVPSSAGKGACLTTLRESSSPSKLTLPVKPPCSVNVSSKLFSFSTIPLSPNSIIRRPLHRGGDVGPEVTVPLSPSTPRPASSSCDHRRKDSKSNSACISATTNFAKRRPMSAQARIAASGGVTTRAAAAGAEELSRLPLSLTGTSPSFPSGYACPSPRPPSSCSVKSISLSPSVNAMKWRSLSCRPSETARTATAAAAAVGSSGLTGGASFFVQSDGEDTKVTNTTPAMIVGSSLLSANKSPQKPETVRADEAGGGNETARPRPTPTPATFRTPREYAVQFPGAILAPRQKHKSRTNQKGNPNVAVFQQHKKEENGRSEISRRGTAHSSVSFLSNGVNSSRVACASTPKSGVGGQQTRRESSVAATRARASISPPRGSSLYAVSNVYVRSSSSLVPDYEVDRFRYWLTSDVPTESAGMASFSSPSGASLFSMTEAEKRDKKAGYGQEADRDEQERGEGRKSVAFTETAQEEAATGLGHSAMVPPTPPPFPSPTPTAGIEKRRWQRSDSSLLGSRTCGSVSSVGGDKKQSSARLPVAIVTFGTSFRDGLVQVGTTACGESDFSAVSFSPRNGRDASLCYSQARGREAIDFSGARRKGEGSPNPTWYVDNSERSEDAAAPQAIPVPAFRKPN